MPSIGPRVHEPRSRDQAHDWRIVHRIDADVVRIVAVFADPTGRTPRRIIDRCKKRPRDCDA
jgi:hypothetical protein